MLPTILLFLVHTVLTDGGSTCGNVSTGTCQPNKDCIEPTCSVLKSFPTTNISECCLACTTLPSCAVYTLHTGGGGNCFLRSAATKPVPGTCTTGVIHLQPPPPPPPPPLPPSSAKNVLFFAVDDLRPELGASTYGSLYVHTPRIDALASKSMVFDRCYTAVSICAPARQVRVKAI